MRKASVSDGLEPPEVELEFHFYHCNLSPGNIILTSLEEVEGEERQLHVAAIIDWEDTGFHPKFWIPFWVAHPLPTFALWITEAQQSDLRWRYRNTLLDALVQLGFQDGEDLLPRWHEFEKKKDDVLHRQWVEEHAQQMS